jgi:phage terminase large subunit-like protein
LNQVVKAGGEKWITDEAWEACADRDRVIEDGSEVVLGFDGSYSNDSTALVVVPMDGKPHIDVVGVWEKKPTDTPEWRAPRLDIMETMRQACKRWKVKEIACDPHIWVAELEQLVEEGLPVVVFEQKGSRLIPATQRFREMALAGELSHSGNPDLARHIGNAMPKTDARGTQLTKDPKRRAKIDLAVASLMAVHRVAELQPEGPPNVWNLDEALEAKRLRESGESPTEPPPPEPDPPTGQRFIPLGDMPPWR